MSGKTLLKSGAVGSVDLLFELAIGEDEEAWLASEWCFQLSLDLRRNVVFDGAEKLHAHEVFVKLHVHGAIVLLH